MISVRVNEIFNYLSTDRKKQVHDHCRSLGRVSNSTEPPRIAAGCVAERSNFISDAEGGSWNSCESQKEGEDDISTLLSSSLLEDNEFTMSKSTSNKPSCEKSSSESLTELSIKVCNSTEDIENIPSIAVEMESNSGSPKAKQKTPREKDKHRKTDCSSINSVESFTQIAVEPMGTCSGKNSPVHASTSDGNFQSRSSEKSSGKMCSVMQPSLRNRKKKSRRNQDRSSSAAALDIRSSSTKTRDCETVCSEKMENIANVKSSEDKPKNSMDICFGESQPTKLILANCHPVGIKVSAATVSNFCQASKFAANRSSGIGDLDSFDDPTFLTASSVSCSRKIDSLDDFDDPLEPMSCQSVPHKFSLTDDEDDNENDNDDQWTEVNRRFKRIVLTFEMLDRVVGSDGGKFDEISRITGAHIEIEEHDDRVIIFIKGSNDQIQSAYNIITTLANRPNSREMGNKKSKGRSFTTGKKPKLKNTSMKSVPSRCQVRTADSAKTLSDCVVNAVAPSKGMTSSRSVELVTSRNAACDSSSEVHNTSKPDADQQNPASPIPLKEYSLFDNIFSRTVEQVLGRRDSPPPPISRRPVVSPMTSLIDCPAVRQPSVIDQALLAKAPGYRSSPPTAAVNQYTILSDIPFSSAGDVHWERRIRKYSDSSSSGRSSEDSGVGSIVNGGFSTHQGAAMSGLLKFDIDAPSLSPPPPTSSWSANSGMFASDQLYKQFTDNSSNGLMSSSTDRGERYSIPDEPMTLPRIASDLNPNAPDFVYDPQHVKKAAYCQQVRRDGDCVMLSSVCSSSSYEMPVMTDSIFNTKAVGCERKRRVGRSAAAVGEGCFDVDDFPPLSAVTTGRQVVRHHASPYSIINGGPF